VRRFFERVATDWDTMHLAYYDERVIERMAEVSGVGENSEVADVGTGTGFVAAGMAPRVKRVVGVDNAPAMLTVARENLTALGASNVNLVVGEATKPSSTWVARSSASITSPEVLQCTLRPYGARLSRKNPEFGSEFLRGDALAMHGQSRSPRYLEPFVHTLHHVYGLPVPSLQPRM